MLLGGDEDKNDGERSPSLEMLRKDGNTVDGKRSPSPQPYHSQKLLCKWEALPIVFAHVNQKGCFTDREHFLCGMSSNWISASYKFFPYL
jgi:hypothetical protein